MHDRLATLKAKLTDIDKSILLLHHKSRGLPLFGNREQMMEAILIQTHNSIRDIKRSPPTTPGREQLRSKHGHEKSSSKDDQYEIKDIGPMGHQADGRGHEGLKRNSSCGPYLPAVSAETIAEPATVAPVRWHSSAASPAHVDARVLPNKIRSRLFRIQKLVFSPCIWCLLSLCCRLPVCLPGRPSLCWFFFVSLSCSCVFVRSCPF